MLAFFWWLIWLVLGGGLFFGGPMLGRHRSCLDRRRTNGGHAFSATLGHFMTDHYGGIVYCFLWVCIFCTHTSMFCFICSLTIPLCIIKAIQPTPRVISVGAPILALAREAVFYDRLFLTDFQYYGMLLWSASLTKRCSFTLPTCFSEKKSSWR